MITNTGDLNDDETKLEQENPNMETQEGQGKNKETRVQNPDITPPPNRCVPGTGGHLRGAGTGGHLRGAGTGGHWRGAGTGGHWRGAGSGVRWQGVGSGVRC